MIVKQLNQIIGTEDDVDTLTWNSRRLLLSKDGLGFSLNHTIIKSGTETMIWYKHHVEAVFCIDGEGEIEVAGDRTYPIRPGTLYVLNGNEKHHLRANSQLSLLCVFDPPLTGREIHDEEGAYPAPVLSSHSEGAK